MEEALKHFHNERYRLWAYCVMPNHIHVVVEPLGGHSLQSILHSWKSYTANRINKILEQTGTLWQQEYFDHLIRDTDSFKRLITYTLENPAKANLKNWKWTSRSSGFQPE